MPVGLGHRGSYCAQNPVSFFKEVGPLDADCFWQNKQLPLDKWLHTNDVDAVKCQSLQNPR